MIRLSDATLGRLPPSVARPGYDRATIGRGVVHLGIGAFHRAHQAVVFERALEAGDRRWGITAASLRSPDTRDRLVPQDGLYSVIERDGDGAHARIIGAIREVIVAPEDPRRLIAAMAAPDTHIVTLTVTEKGYCLDPATGALQREAAPVAADLASLDRPRTAIGFLVAALAARRRAGLAPFTAIACDNLPGNGARLREAALTMARAHDPALADWIGREAAFPDTMVDRIVPATTAQDLASNAAATGITDEALVTTEPFLQWIIEDRFCGPRPDFARFGALLTGDVTPWEDAKLRLLNGAHSAMAYVGLLDGRVFVDEVFADPAGRAFVEALWDEAAATLTPPAGLDIPAYRVALAGRFANPALRHRLRQITTDGSQKVPQRLLAPIAWRLRRDLPIAASALAIAAWIACLVRHDDIPDPRAAAIRARLAPARTARDRVAAVLSMPEFTGDPRLETAVTGWLDVIAGGGIAAAIAHLVSRPR